MDIPLLRPLESGRARCCVKYCQGTIFFFFLVIFIKHEPHSTKYIFYYIYISTFTDPYMYIQTYLPSCLFSYLVILKRIRELGRTPERRNWKKKIFKKGLTITTTPCMASLFFMPQFCHSPLCGDSEQS